MGLPARLEAIGLLHSPHGGHLLTVAEVNAVIARPKILVATMAWVKKLNREQTSWREFLSAVQFMDDQTEAPEQLLVRCSWRPKVGVMPESWTFALWLQGERVYATDFQPMVNHRNKVGVGRPYYNKVVRGMHEHTWSGEGYGYVEPLSLAAVPPGVEAWKMFTQRAGIVGSGFVHPDKAVNAGQQGLDL